MNLPKQRREKTRTRYGKSPPDRRTWYSIKQSNGRFNTKEYGGARKSYIFCMVGYSTGKPDRTTVQNGTVIAFHGRVL